MRNWLWSADIVEYEKSGTLANEERKQDMENFISIGKTVNNSKNFVFMGCNTAFGCNIIADYLSKGLLMTVDKAYKDKNFNRNLIIPKYYNEGWIKSTGGVSTNIKNLQINQYGIKVIK